MYVYTSFTFVYVLCVCVGIVEVSSYSAVSILLTVSTQFVLGEGEFDPGHPIGYTTAVNQ